MYTSSVERLVSLATMGVEWWSCVQYTALCVFPLMNLPDQCENTSADISNGSGFFTSSSETWTQRPELPSPTQTRPREHPGVQQTRAYRRALDASGDIHEQVVRVLQKIEDEQLNLTIFLWALSWKRTLEKQYENSPRTNYLDAQ